MPQKKAAKSTKKVVAEKSEEIEKKPNKTVKKAEPEVISEPIPEPVSNKKPAKNTKKVEEDDKKINIEKKEIKKSDEINIDDIDEEQLKIWKSDWFYIIEKYTELKKEQELLEIKRDEVVKKMNDYLMAKKGLVAENIIDSSTKMKKTINKVDMSLNKLEDDNDLDEEDSDDSDEDDESEEATPAGPLKKGSKIIKFNASKTSGKKDDSDSD